MIGDPYLRRKENKWIIEQKIEGKTKYIMTLPPLKEIIEWKRLPISAAKASKATQETKGLDGERFVQSPLTEQSKIDALLNEVIPPLSEDQREKMKEKD